MTRAGRTSTGMRKAVRARMAATGQNYTTARREIRAEIAARPTEPDSAAGDATEPDGPAGDATEPAAPTPQSPPGGVPPVIFRAPDR